MTTTQNTDYLNILQRLRRKEGLFRVLMFTLVTVLCWIGFSILWTQQTTTITSDVQRLTNPLSPNINRDAFTEIANRRTFTDEELASFPIYKVLIDADGNRTIVDQNAVPIPTTETQAPVATNEAQTAPETSTQSAQTPGQQ